jgi:alpha 1,3-mannosyltransferase
MGTVEEDPRQKHKVAENVALTKSEDISKDTGNDENSKTSEEGHESHERPPVFTICGPQLLHLGLDNRPLWFNGWLLPNKFFEEKDQEPANFTAYLQEPLDIREPGAWQLRENNICCLTSRRAFEFTREEKDVLEMIIDAGRRSGALGKGKN